VIDDEHNIRLALRKMLEGAGYEVTEASNGKEGTEQFAASPPDVVITDILMPEKDGVEVLLEFRRDHPEVKIIAISGRGHGFLPIAEEFGAFRSLAKPFRQPEVLDAVRAALQDEEGRGSADSGGGR